MHLFHPTAQISALCDIEDSQRGNSVVIGAHSFVDAFVKVKFAGGGGNVEIGEHCYLNSGCVIYSGNGVKLGNHVAVAANCTFAPVNHAFLDRHRLIAEQRFAPSKGGILIEDDVWIGANCVLLDGTIIRRGCVIGAGSLVRGELPAYSIHCGNPLQLVGHRQ